MAVTAAILLASPAHAQNTAERDSILARLERAEEQIALLRQQLATQASSGVQSRSGARLELWGRVLANAWRNSGVVNSLDVPTFALLHADPYPATTGAAFRQTTLGLDLSGIAALGGELRASISADFFGGVQAGSGNRRLFPEPRLRIARATLHWSHVELLLGQDVPPVAPVEPISLASMGTPNFALAGNLWFWLPQVAMTVETGGPVRFGVQGALVAPWSGEDPAISGNVDMGERSDRPYLQGRLRAAWGDPARPGELGIGGHAGWLRRSAQQTRDESHALVASLQVPAGWFDLRGEAYQGTLLRGLGGGAIGQNFGMVAAQPLDSEGIWMQLNVQPHAVVLLGGGCGIDVVDEDGRPGRSRNRACEGHVHLRPGGPVVLGVEVRKLTTRYPIPRESANSTHVNLAVGIEF